MTCKECGGGRKPLGNTWTECETCKAIKQELADLKVAFGDPANRRAHTHIQMCKFLDELLKGGE